MDPISVVGEAQRKYPEEIAPGEQADGRRMQLTQRSHLVSEEKSDAHRLYRLPKRGQPRGQGATMQNMRAAGHRTGREQKDTAALECASPTCVRQVENGRVATVSEPTGAVDNLDHQVKRLDRGQAKQGAYARRLKEREQHCDGVAIHAGRTQQHNRELELALLTAHRELELAAQQLAVYAATEEARARCEEAGRVHLGEWQVVEMPVGDRALTPGARAPVRAARMRSQSGWWRQGTWWLRTGPVRSHL